MNRKKTGQDSLIKSRAKTTTRLKKAPPARRHSCGITLSTADSKSNPGLTLSSQNQPRTHTFAGGYKLEQELNAATQEGYRRWMGSQCYGAEYFVAANEARVANTQYCAKPTGEHNLIELDEARSETSGLESHKHEVVSMPKSSTSGLPRSRGMVDIASSCLPSGGVPNNLIGENWPRKKRGKDLDSARYLREQREKIHSQSSVTSASRLSHARTGQNKTYDKIFIICCRCNCWHDLPAKLYRQMSNTIKDSGASCVSTQNVECPYCRHEMRTTCCEGWRAIAKLEEQLH
jgi:hypothetical protein